MNGKHSVRVIRYLVENLLALEFVRKMAMSKDDYFRPGFNDLSACFDGYLPHICELEDLALICRAVDGSSEDFLGYVFVDEIESNAQGNREFRESLVSELEII